MKIIEGKLSEGCNIGEGGANWDKARREGDVISFAAVSVCVDMRWFETLSICISLLHQSVVLLVYYLSRWLTCKIRGGWSTGQTTGLGKCSNNVTQNVEHVIIAWIRFGVNFVACLFMDH